MEEMHEVEDQEEDSKPLHRQHLELANTIYVSFAMYNKILYTLWDSSVSNPL